MGKFWLTIRLSAIVLCGVPNLVFPSLVGTIIPFLLVCVQALIIVSIIATYVHLHRRKRRRRALPPVKWE